MKRRVAVWPPRGGDVATHPPDPVAALPAGAAALDRAYRVRWAPRDVATTRRRRSPHRSRTDRRHIVAIAELVALAADADPLRGLAAATSLP